MSRGYVVFLTVCVVVSALIVKTGYDGFVR